jgi:plasmid replication initiation protein
MSENDVFHACAHLSKKQKHESTKIEFISKDVLNFISWGTDGKNHVRFRGAVENLFNVRIDLMDMRGSAYGVGSFRIISDFYLKEKGKAGDVR